MSLNSYSAFPTSTAAVRSKPVDNGLAQLVAQLGPWDLFLTFATRYKRISFTEMTHNIEMWHRKLDRKLLGRSWAKKQDRSILIGCFENRDRNLHVHCTYRFPVVIKSPRWDSAMPHERAEMMRSLWTTVIPTGDLCVSDVHYESGLAHYINKQQGDPKLRDHVIVLKSDL
jgi:hypothetical protein